MSIDAYLYKFVKYIPENDMAYCRWIVGDDDNNIDFDKVPNEFLQKEDIEVISIPKSIKKAFGLNVTGGIFNGFDSDVGYEFLVNIDGEYKNYQVPMDDLVFEVVTETVVYGKLVGTNYVRCKTPFGQRLSTMNGRVDEFDGDFMYIMDNKTLDFVKSCFPEDAPIQDWVLRIGMFVAFQ